MFTYAFCNQNISTISCFLVSLQFTFKLILFQQQFAIFFSIISLVLSWRHGSHLLPKLYFQFYKVFFILFFKTYQKKWMIFFFFKRIIFFPMNYWFCFRSLAVLRILFRFVFRFLPPGNWEGVGGAARSPSNLCIKCTYFRYAIFHGSFDSARNKIY